MQPDEEMTQLRAVDQGGGDIERFISSEPPDHNPFADYPEGVVPPAFGGPLPMGTTAVLAHNLAVRRQRIWTCWGNGVVVGWIGDQTHQSECSDHNKDATGVVHAIDVMVTGARAEATVTGCLAHPDDLQYVIHNRTIWSVTTGWQPRKYLGSDPHTNHVHASGKHGGSHRSTATCTGYNLVAQSSTPTFDPCPAQPQGDLDNMTPAEMQSLANMIGDAVVTKLVTKDLGKAGGGDTIGVVLQSGVLQNSNKVVQALGDLGAKLDEIAAKLPPAA